MIPNKSVRVAAFLLAATAFVACSSRRGPAQPTDAPSSAPTAATAPPSTAAVYTGPATLVRSDRPYSGRVVDAVTFVDCANATIHLQSTDSVTPGGSCTTEYDLQIRTSARSAVEKQIGAGQVLINSVSQEGNTAVATYVRGHETGQVLLIRTNGSWVPKSTTSGSLTATSGAPAGVPAATLHRLQNKLQFDIAATPLPASSH